MRKSEDDTFLGWLCACGHWEESDYHCSLCGNEPPWGCDCGDHEPEDEDKDAIPFYWNSE